MVVEASNSTRKYLKKEERAMKSRFGSWILEHLKAVVSICVLVGAIVAVASTLMYYPALTVERYCVYLNKSCDEITVYSAYKDGHTELVGTFTQSIEGPGNTLRNPLYLGCFVDAMGYDPLGMYKAGVDVPFFEFNRGAEYGDYGAAKFDERTGRLAIVLSDRIVSWVDEDGVIASAAIFDNELHVAFYRKDSLYRPPLALAPSGFALGAFPFTG